MRYSFHLGRALVFRKVPEDSTPTLSGLCRRAVAVTFRPQSGEDGSRSVGRPVPRLLVPRRVTGGWQLQLSAHQLRTERGRLAVSSSLPVGGPSPPQISAPAVSSSLPVGGPSPPQISAPAVSSFYSIADSSRPSPPQILAPVMSAMSHFPHVRCQFRG